MHVIKRDGRRQPVSFDKILERIKRLSDPSYEHIADDVLKKKPDFHKLSGVDPALLTQKVIDRLYDGISTRQLDEETARLAAGMETQNMDYGVLSKRILVSNLHKNTHGSFSSVMKKLYVEGSIADYMYFIITRYGDIIDKEIKYERDYRCNYFGFKTLEKLYLLKNKNLEISERIQHMWMRVAIAIFKEDILGKGKGNEQDNLLNEHAEVNRKETYVTDYTRSNHIEEIRNRKINISISDIDFAKLDSVLTQRYGNVQDKPNFTNIFRLYNHMSQGYCTHATPTLFNSGTRTESYISCFLKSLSSDSIDGMYQDNREIAKLFQSAGGVGYHLHDMRARGALINTSNGLAEGIVPFVKVLNDTSRHVKQGGRRNGSLALYLEVWHLDIMDFLELKKPQGNENARARDLFYALWICDLFMEAVKKNDWWYLMTPDECPGLSNCYGSEFNKLYQSYISRGMYRRKIKAQEIWKLITDIRIETGTPYMASKDASNKKSNQQNLGTIKSSNLCCEINLYSSPEETADCVLASVALCAMFTEKNEFDFKKLGYVVELEVDALNRVIDCNNYPNEKTRRSNMRHRPIGIGVQGLANCFIQLRLPFGSAEARILNRKIFETIYYHAVKRSMELAKKDGHYESFPGCPASQGKLQFDLWDKDINKYGLMGFDWESLKKDVVKYGLRNSTLLALMPTASTSIILGNNECMEPITSNLYKRKTLAGEFVILNKYLVNDLEKLGLWNKEIKDYILAMNGSIQHIPGIPDDLKQLYQTVWEMKQKIIVDMAIERGPYICQSQSMNLYFENPTTKRITDATFYGWKHGLKTLCYYTRTRPATDPLKFTIDLDVIKKASMFTSTIKEPEVVCNDDICITCSS